MAVAVSLSLLSLSGIIGYMDLASSGSENVTMNGVGAGGGIADMPDDGSDQSLRSRSSTVPPAARTRICTLVSGSSSETVYSVSVVWAISSVSSNVSSMLICTPYPIAPSDAVQCQVMEFSVVSST